MSTYCEGTQKQRGEGGVEHAHRMEPYSRKPVVGVCEPDPKQWKSPDRSM